MLHGADHALAARFDLRRLPDQHTQDVAHGPVDVLLPQLAGFQQLLDGKAVVVHGEHHFHVEARLEAAFGVVDAVDKIRHHKAIKAPLVPEDVGQQLFTCAAVVAVELVVGAHDGLGPGVDALFEVG